MLAWCTGHSRRLVLHCPGSRLLNETPQLRNPDQLCRWTVGWTPRHWSPIATGWELQWPVRNAVALERSVQLAANGVSWLECLMKAG